MELLARIFEFRPKYGTVGRRQGGGFGGAVGVGGGMKGSERIGWVVVVIVIFLALIYLSRPSNTEQRIGNLILHSSVDDSSKKQPAVLLELLAWRCTKEDGFTFVRGDVKNISSRSLDNVEVVGEFRTKSGVLVKTASALLTYNPILPSQTSPFTAGTSDNPRIIRCRIGFRTLLGERISYTTPKEIQRELLGLGYKIGKPDGVIGSKTRAAIRAFQRKVGLPVDGEVSSSLIRHLRNAEN